MTTTIAPTIAPTIATTDSNLAPGQEGRLTGQNERILKLLQRGPRTNVFLAAIAKKYTSRISDLRSHGHLIRCDFVDRKEGLTQYTYEGFATPGTLAIVEEIAQPVTVTLNQKTSTGQLLRTCTATRLQKSRTLTLTDFSEPLVLQSGDTLEIIGV